MKNHLIKMNNMTFRVDNLFIEKTSMASHLIKIIGINKMDKDFSQMIDALETSHLIEIRDFNKMSSLVGFKKGHNLLWDHQNLQINRVSRIDKVAINPTSHLKIVKI